MKKYFVMFNPLSNNGMGETSAKEFEKTVSDGEFEYKSVLEIEDYASFIEGLPGDCTPVLAGGDGTLNRFVNSIGDNGIEREILYFPAGSGNDFMRDVSKDGSLKYVTLNPYIVDLPKVEINGKVSKFINGIGFGIDGYCCEVGDELRKTSDKPINYAGIAIKGLLFHFKPRTATVDTDGTIRTFKGCWLAPTMFGRFYGGGMNAAPLQNRLAPEKKVTTMLMYGKGRLATLMVFPSIFKGEHVKHSEMCTTIAGNNVSVSFDIPCALQIDGETVLNVTSYKVFR